MSRCCHASGVEIWMLSKAASMHSQQAGARPEMFKWVGRHKHGWARCIAAGTYFEQGGGAEK